MKKSDDQTLDELYRSSFEDGNTLFDKEAMWSELEPYLPGKERRILFWMNLLLGTFLIGYFVLSLTYGGPVTETKTQAVAKEKLTVPEIHEIATPTTILRAVSENNKSSLKTTSSLIDEKQISELENSTGSFTNITASTSDLRSTSENETTSPLSNDLSIDVGMINSQKTITGLSLPSISNFENKQLPRRPDPNKWSQCSIKDQPHIFSDIYTFAGRPFINNQENPDPSNDNAGFLEQWNEGESPVATYGFGMMVGIGAYWGGTFSAGLEYQKVQNKINRSQTVIERITVYDEMAYYYLDSNNNRIWVADSVTSTRIYSRELQASKTHTLVNLPLLLGYHLEKGNWRAGITAGINVHLLHSFSGKVLDPSGQIIDGDTGTPTAVYDKDLGFSIIGGFDLGYFITLQTELYVSPRFRYNPKSWLNPGHPLESRIQMVGLQAGARWHF